MNNPEGKCVLQRGVHTEELRLLGCDSVGFVITDVSEELSASFIRLTRIGGIGTTLAVTSNRRLLQYVVPEDATEKIH
jgi:hypothetical protein